MLAKHYEILLPLKFDQLFTYKSALLLKKGDVVLVSFGKKNLYGVVYRALPARELPEIDAKKIKEIPASGKNDSLNLEENLLEFIDKISAYNMAPRGLVLKAFIGFLNSDKVQEKTIAKTVAFAQKIDAEKFDLKKLSQNQLEIALKIEKDFAHKKVALIDGVTGSGKTEIYFKMIADKLIKNKDAQILIMLPEIALTSQLLTRFEDVFGFKPALWHSKISKKDKREIFYGVANNSTKVLIGARSSLLLPFKNLKLIIVDEEHDSSYKQDEGFNFNARDMAILKAQIDNSRVILCSATPSLESYANGMSGKYNYYPLEEKFNKKENAINIIDLRQNKPEKGDHISRKLREELAKNFALNHQSLLFLNRRGYAPALICGKCGQKTECLNCATNLVYHKSLKRNVCHYCGHNEKFDETCKKCGEENAIITLGVGVEKIAEEVKEVLPQARIAVVTSDNLNNFKDAQEIVQKISDNQIDVIIGTQMIAKGYDFPNLTLVGLVDVDSGFYSSDLKSSEKSFQLLSQVMGRAGRKNHAGRVFVQSYNPENFILKKLIANDKNGFYNFELQNRKIVNLPPFSKMAQITFSSLKNDDAVFAAKDFTRKVPFDESIEIIGPAPAKIMRLRNKFYHNLFLKTDKKINLQKLIFNVINLLDIKNTTNIKIDIDP